MRLPKPIRDRTPLLLRFLAARLLPLTSRRRSAGVSDLQTHGIGAGVVLDVYWLDTGDERGPAASLYVADDEVMRFDCTSRDSAHLHFNRKQSRAIPDGGGARLYFPPGGIADHIERACFELGTNWRYAFAVNFSRRVRNACIEPAALAEAVAFLRCEMHALVRAHGAGAAGLSGAQMVGEAAQHGPSANKRA